MRKEFILPLTALATAFLATSAAALGPVCSGVPDVYIGPQAAMGAPVEPGTNTFRYSSALTLWDYVTPGVAVGDGSNSDTLYQAWAIKDATLSGPTGGYLPAGSGVHYSILQENAVDALFLQPAVEIGGPGWAAEINNALNAQGAALSDYSLANAGALTFRNVRLSPIPEQAGYPEPTKSDAGLPNGIWDAQEATLYVSDTNTTPAAEKLLLVTVDTGADFLSGGIPPGPWTLVQDYSADTSAFARFKFKGNENGTEFVFDPAELVIWDPVSMSSLRIQTPVANYPPGYWYYGQCAAIQATVDPAYLYRMKASLTAPGGTLNPSILLAFNARGNAGYGFVQTNSGANTLASPSSAPSTWNAFLAPLEPGTPQAQFIVFDSSSTAGGTVEASAIQIWRIALADLLASAEVVQATDTSFAVSATGAATSTEWGYFDMPFSTGGSPTFTRTPANGASGPIIMSAATATANIGMGSFQGPTASIPTTPGKMVIIRARLSTSSSASAKLPTVWLNTEGPTIQGGAFIQRDNAGTTGPSTTPRDYYLVFEAKDSVCAFNFRILADQASINGNVQLIELEVLEADLPLGP